MADQLPTPGQAMDTLASLYNNILFVKLAAYGYTPQSPVEAQQYLHLAEKLRAASEIPAVKSAAYEDSLITQASDDLDTVIGALDSNKSAAERHVALKQASADLATNAQLYTSVVALKIAEAERMASAA